MTELTKLEKLKRAFAEGHIDQETLDAAVAAMNAKVTGGGAIAQGQGAAAAGAGGVGVGGANYGDINTGVVIQIGTRQGASKGDLRRAYLARVLTQGDQLPLFAGDSANAQIRLSAVYTALLTQRSEVRAEHEVQPGDRWVKQLSALEVLNAEQKLVLLGGPGSGKSTFANFVALAMAGELLGATGPNLKTLTTPLPKEEQDSEEPQPQRWEHGALLPVQVTLRDLASQLPVDGARVGAEAVWEFIRGRLKQAALENFAEPLRDELLQRGGLVLFDGLDEVPDANHRREQIKHAVQDFVATFARCRFLVTSRTYAYQRQEWKLDGFSEVLLQPFTPAQINAFVDAWYAHMVSLDRLTEAAASDRAEVLKRTVERNERIRELAERPLLLTLIAQLQTERGGTLPERREALYDRAVEMLLNQWESMKSRVRADGSKEVEPSLAEWLNAGRDDIRKQLNRLAFEAHRDQLEAVGTADIPQDKLVNALLNASAKRADVKVKRLEEYLRDRAGILAAHGDGVYQFPHRSFQEYLAACHLTDEGFPDIVAKLARSDANRWREVALLAGAKAARGSSLFVWALSEALCHAEPAESATAEADHWGALLAGRALVESADLAHIAPPNAAKLARIRQWQVHIMRQTRLPAVERALAGRSLAVLGDPRTEVMTLDDTLFCFVPSGSFVMGSDNGSLEEQPQHEVNLPYPFWIAHFPVSVAQWHEYLGQNDFELSDNRAYHGRSNEPAINVSWHNALAFCEFLTNRWRNWLPEGYRVMLPSEAEWEKAARGGKNIPTQPIVMGVREIANKMPSLPGSLSARIAALSEYSWGEQFDAELLNSNAIGIGEPNALGCFPRAVSLYGCEEMNGNVWEWTRSLWGSRLDKPLFSYPYDPGDSRREDLTALGDIRRIVRGGSWFNHGEFARSTSRYGCLPSEHDDAIGFRVVLRASPVL